MKKQKFRLTALTMLLTFAVFFLQGFSLQADTQAEIAEPEEQKEICRATESRFAA